MIKDLIENKTVPEKQTIKAVEIAKLNHVGIFDNGKYGVRVEILELKQGESKGQMCVEILARAWKGVEQFGFGDGSVEIERFRIFNPPILVEDPNGEVVRMWDEKDLKTGLPIPKERRLREDPIEAIRQTLAHTISLVGKKNTPIVKGKIGNTTSTFYPAAGVASPIDGMVYDSGADRSWATLIAAAGSGVDITSSDYYYAYFESLGGTNLWYVLIRTIITFDTSSIPDTDTIESAVLSIFGTGKADPTTNTPNLDIYISTPANTNDLVAGDYAQLGSTSQTGSPITYANWSTIAYNDFTFSATGRGNISKTGISKFGARNANYDVAAAAPTWASGGNTTYLRGYTADQAGTANDPKLVVVHSAAATSGKNFLAFMPQ